MSKSKKSKGKKPNTGSNKNNLKALQNSGKAPETTVAETPAVESVSPDEVITPAGEVVDTSKPAKDDNKTKDTKDTKNDKKSAKKPEKIKKAGLGKKVKDTASELKKVSWPAFGTVVKKTGVVIAVVLFFGAILLAFDYLLKLLYDLLTSGIV